VAKKKKTTKKATRKAAKRTTKKATKKAAKRTTKKATKKAAKTTKKAAPKKKRKANPALLKPMTPNAALAAVVGSKPLPRGQVMKKIWAYVKTNKLQDPKNGQYINSDARLKNLFKKGRVHMTEFGKVLKAPFLT
jgi:upstream activation factor subunit UAF30